MKLLFFFILNFQYLYIVSTIVFPFKKNTTEYNHTYHQNIYNYFSKRIYINISIGTPPQIIPTYLNFDQSSFYFSSEENKLYNKLDSSSYKQLQQNRSFDKEFFGFGNFSSETLLIKNEKNKEIKLNDFQFILASNHIYEDFKPGVIGLKHAPNLIVSNSSFVSQLKNKKVIDNKIYYFLYKKDDEGEFVIGKYPHEYHNKMFQKENLRLVKADEYQGFPLWSTKFDNFYFGDKLIKKEIVTFVFRTEFSFLIGSNSFFQDCSQYFFKDYLDQNKCQIDKNDTGSLFYVCDDDIDIKKFPIIKLTHKIWNYTFELTYKDLFLKSKNKYFFLICFKTYYNDLWTLGDLFLRKYTIVFDQENKVIGFYHPSNNSKISLIIFYIIFIFLLILLSMLIYIYLNYLRKGRRKIRNNEIDENYEYLIKE